MDFATWNAAVADVTCGSSVSGWAAIAIVSVWADAPPTSAAATMRTTLRQTRRARLRGYSHAFSISASVSVCADGPW
jgi:hypothetical protein